MFRYHALQRWVGKQIVALIWILATCGVSPHAYAQAGGASLPASPANLDFESGRDPSGFPNRWGGGGEGYRLELDTQASHGGRGCGRIRFVNGNEHGFATFTQRVAPGAYRGKRVHYSGWLMVRSVNEGWAGMWMRVNGPNNQVFAL